MIENNYILDLIEENLFGTDRFLVELKISTDNKIRVIIDGDSGVTIDSCVALSRHIEGNLDRDKEDFELSVYSAGIDRPFSMLRQYTKNIGRAVKILTVEDKTIRGILKSATSIQIEVLEETKRKNKKNKKVEYGEIITILMKDISKTKK
eukprot:Anaeramoba_flamelloidesa574179_19.p1 GENE.a574179_19~~a574179_19.p1  ORF type:complete len:150 (+),score=12.72 a574179_19:106-555(+)